MDYSNLTAQELQQAYNAYLVSAASGFKGGEENMAALKNEMDRRSRNQKILIGVALLAVFFFVK